VTAAVPPQLVLASGSAHRRALLDRLLIPYDWESPDIDETGNAGETAPALAARLAREKAEAVARRRGPGQAAGRCLVTGSDQVAECGGRHLGKPGSRARAAAQLRDVAGREVRFHTAVHVVDTTTGAARAHVDLTRVQFRALDSTLIEAYLDRENALDCAGAFKSEGLGIALIEHLETSDPTALVGLPLIWLCGALNALGLSVPARR
jgi:septum formation protein